MRIETTTRTLYFFNELSDKAKQKAIEKLYDINVDFEWWDSTYEDAERIGLKITGFDIDRASYCKGELTMDPPGVIAAILKEHGDQCGTYQLAKEWETYNFYPPLGYEEGEEPDLDEDKAEEFTLFLCEEYLSILRNEYEYLTSEAAIIDTIEANEYEFTENGEMA
jgi:hypothetical protein